MTHYVYHCWHGDELLYIGVTDNVSIRMAQHEKLAEWHFLVTSVTTQAYPLRMLAEEAERVAIGAERPPFNVRGVLGEMSRHIDEHCGICTLENTVTPSSAHWDLAVPQDRIMAAYESGEVHGHPVLRGHPKLLIDSVLSWHDDLVAA